MKGIAWVARGTQVNPLLESIWALSWHTSISQGLGGIT